MPPALPGYRQGGTNTARALVDRVEQVHGPFQLLHAANHREPLPGRAAAFRAFTRLAYGRAATRRKRTVSGVGLASLFDPGPQRARLRGFKSKPTPAVRLQRSRCWRPGASARRHPVRRTVGLPGNC